MKLADSTEIFILSEHDPRGGGEIRQEGGRNSSGGRYYIKLFCSPGRGLKGGVAPFSKIDNMEGAYMEP